MKSVIFLGLFLSVSFQVCCQDSTYTWVDVSEFELLAQDSNNVIVDVRTPEEAAEGMIQNAKVINVNADDFVDIINDLDKEKTYLVYCRSGKRSTIACEQMVEAGFKKLYNLKGGFLQWQKEHP